MGSPHLCVPNKMQLMARSCLLFCYLKGYVMSKKIQVPR